MTALAVGPSAAQTTPAADPPACAEILKAKTADEAYAVYQPNLDRLEAEGLALRKAQEGLEASTGAALKSVTSAKKELGTASGELAKLTNEATAYSVPWLKEELRKAKKELDELQSTNKVQATERVKNLEQRLSATIDSERLVRRGIGELERTVLKAQEDHKNAQQREQQGRAEVEKASARIFRLAACQATRIAQLNPETAKDLQRMEAAMANIERALAEIEKIVRRAPSVCPPAQAAIPAMKKNAIELTAALRQLTADANAGALTPSPAIPKDAAAARQRTRDAAAKVSSLRKHAEETAQSTCSASQSVMAAPRDPLAATNLAEVLKLRLLTERDVELAAAALNEIRAAYATTGTAGAPSAAVAPGSLATQLDALRQRSRTELGAEARVKSMTDLHAFLRDADAAHRALNKFVEDFGKIRKEIEGSDSGRKGWAWQIYGPRFLAAAQRKKASEEAMACAVTLQADLEAAAKEMEATSTALTAAEGAVASAEKKAIAADPRAEIELTFAAARDEADTVAVEAVKAVKCAVEAENAVKTAAPAAPTVAPPTGRGVKCTYVMSWTASPQPVQYEIVDYGGGDCPSITNSFPTAASVVSGPPPAGSPWVGRWAGRSTWHIYGVGNTFVIDVPWGKVSPFGTTWVAVCQTTGANTATCKGGGEFDGTDRVTSFTVAVELTLNGNTINYRYQYPYAKIGMKDPGRPVSGSEIRTGGTGSGMANRQN
ncbi:MAG: hypothetical protein ACT4O6_24375 [Reyranella sp.]